MVVNIGAPSDEYRKNAHIDEASSQLLHTVLVERLKSSFHCTDLVFSLFDAEFYAPFDCVIFKIDILQFFKICPFSNALCRTVGNEITDSCYSPKCCTVVAECL